MERRGRTTISIVSSYGETYHQKSNLFLLTISVFSGLGAGTVTNPCIFVIDLLKKIMSKK